MFVPRLIFYRITFVLGTVVGKLLSGREDAIALVYGTAPKNLSIALAIAMIAFGPQGAEIALIIALAYAIQIQASAWCNKFVNRCFGLLTRRIPCQVSAGGNPPASPASLD